MSTVTHDTLHGTLSGSSFLSYNETAIGTWPGENNYVGTIYVPISGSVIEDWIKNTNPTIPTALMGIPLDADGQQLSSAEAPILTSRPTLHLTYTFD